MKKKYKQLKYHYLISLNNFLYYSNIFLYKCHISPFEHGNRYNHDPLRTRKLLLKKQEINKLIGKMKESGLTLVPINMHLEHGFAKVEIALAKGKTLHDKRETISKKTAQREIEKAMKRNYI